MSRPPAASPRSRDGLSPVDGRPRVSIGLPVYNGERYLAAAIESVLAQSFGDFELIICDNASTDATAPIARAFVERDSRLRYYRNDVNAGAARNFSRCFHLARGDYFKWLACDDLMAPEFLDRCLAALEAAPAAVLAYSEARGIDAEGRPLQRLAHAVPLAAQADVAERLRAFREEADFRHGARAWPMLYIFGLVRAPALRRTDVLAPYINSDSNTVLQLLLQGPFVAVEGELLQFRHHAGSYSVYATDDRARQRFFDPRAHFGPAQLLGHRRVYIEYGLSVLRSRLSARDKTRVLLELARWPLRRRALARRALSAPPLPAPSSREG